jgi:hypothetical protein
MQPSHATLLLALTINLSVQADYVDTHKIFLPEDIRWGPPPQGLPAGAEAAVLYGDPKIHAPFLLRLKARKGYAVPPHSHGQPEYLTVISGQVRLGLGKSADRNTVQILPAGAFSIMPQGVLHYLFVDEDAVVQINGLGPWSLDYGNPKDDPRQQSSFDSQRR